MHNDKVTMDAESQLLADKDAEIERLKALVKHWSDAASKYEHKIVLLNKLNLMTDEQVVMDLKEQVERLKEVIASDKRDFRTLFEDRKMDLQTIRMQKGLITELADALVYWQDATNYDDQTMEARVQADLKLAQRAREVAKNE